MRNVLALLRAESRLATTFWGPLSRSSKVVLKTLIENHLSVSLGDLAMIDGRWYVTHTGLLRFAKRRGCFGIRGRLRNAANLRVLLQQEPLFWESAHV
jgi:hypothetical protein